MDTDDVVARNNVRIIGEGEQTLMFAHGFGCDQTIWSRLLPWFEADYRIILFDYVGSGHSDASAYDSRRYGRIDGYAQDVVDICRTLDLRDTVLVGHSISAMIPSSRRHCVAITRANWCRRAVMPRRQPAPKSVFSPQCPTSSGHR